MPLRRVSLRTTGGFAHFSRGAAGWFVATEDLGSADIAAIEVALSAAAFFERRSPTPSLRTRGARTYRVTVEMDAESRTLEISEPFEDQTLSNLLRVVREVLMR